MSQGATGGKCAKSSDIKHSLNVSHCLHEQNCTCNLDAKMESRSSLFVKEGGGQPARQRALKFPHGASCPARCFIVKVRLSSFREASVTLGVVAV